MEKILVVYKERKESMLIQDFHLTYQHHCLVTNVSNPNFTALNLHQMTDSKGWDRLNDWVRYRWPSTDNCQFATAIASWGHTTHPVAFHCKLSTSLREPKTSSWSQQWLPKSEIIFVIKTWAKLIVTNCWPQNTQRPTEVYAGSPFARV